MTVEPAVAAHYTHGALLDAIDAALRAAGKDPAHLAPADLAPVDEFHIGGRPATVAFAAELGVAPGQHWLDIGSGIGGASRYFAHELGCRVSGIDLTDEYVAVATALASRVGLSDRVDYRQGSALDLPFAAASFDGAVMMHVGMNISDKAALFAGVRRVLKPGAVFGIYDVMHGEGAIAFPVPWAMDESTSFVADAETYRRLLEAAGFVVEKERNRRDAARALFAETRARVAQSGPPALGIQVLLGATAGPRLANMVGNVESGAIAPTEIVSRAA